MLNKKMLAFVSFALSALMLISCGQVEPRTETVIGTVCTVNAYEDGTKKLYDQLFDCLRKIDSQFSRTIENSQVNKVNELAGVGFADVDKEVFFVAEKALYFACITEGAFDPTVGPLVDLWGIGSGNARIPERYEIKEALNLIDFKKMTLRVLDEQNNVVFEKSGAAGKDDLKKLSVLENGNNFRYQIMLAEKNMKLELGGIAKGYAADCLVEILNKNKVKRAVIDLGGNIYVHGKKPQGNWSVGIKNPVDGRSVAAVVEAEPDSSVVTSGVYERFFEEDGVRFHHIMDLKSGMPSWGGSSEILKAALCGTTVVCKKSIDADALSTIAFLLGPENFFAFVEENKDVLGDVKSVFISMDKKIALSQNMTESLKILDEEFEEIK